MKKCNLEKLLENSLESFYWIGFILADGHISKSTRLKVTLAKKDKDHLIKLQKFLNIEILKEDDQVSISAMDSKILKEFCEKFDIKSNKTEYPPNIKIFKSFDNNLLKALMIGFIDGDGSICNLHNRKDYKISIKCYYKWVNFLNLLSKCFNTDNVAYINNQGYAFISIGNSIKCKEIKRFILDNNIPVLARKWNIIDLNFKGRNEQSIENEILVKSLYNNFSQKEICTKVNLTKGRISQIIKKLKNDTK
jgi:hypothetical protein